MLLAPKQIKSYIYLLMLCCSGMYLTKAMEQQTSEMEKKVEEKQVNFWANVPKEIKTHIISFLESAKDEKEAVRNIKALSLTSKYFHNLISDPKVLGSLIEELSKRFNISPIDVALDFNNPGALHWLEIYIQQNPLAEGLLGQHLLKAAKTGNKNSAEFLLNAGAHVNTADEILGTTSLDWAASKGHKEIVELLLNAGADAKQEDITGATALHGATANGHDNIVELLLKAGADVNKADNEGKTPLHYAATRGHKGTAKLLLDAGAHVNDRNNDGYTPLDNAVEEGKKDIVELLLKAGANVNTTDYSTSSPLHRAAKKGNKDIVELLLGAGANVNKANKYGVTPLRIAANHGNWDTVELLRKHGAVK
jgi:ankyrin repeat protein